MPEPVATGSPENFQTLLDSIFNAKDWRQRVESELKNLARLRRKNAELTAELEKAKGAAPKDGALVLSKEEAEQYKAIFNDMKLKPADIKTIIAERDTLKGKIAEREAEESFAAAGEALGWANISALTRFLKRENLVLDFKDLREKDDAGKTITRRLPVVRPKADDRAAFEPLDEYVEREVPEYVDIFATAPVAAEDDDAATTTDAGITGNIPRRRAASTSKPDIITGVPIIGTPRIRQGSTTNAAALSQRDKKTLAQAEDEARASGTYNV